MGAIFALGAGIADLTYPIAMAMAGGMGLTFGLAGR